ncbi:MAG: hypothetical protein NT099_02165 [Candidatus Saganbacteria bacterium]|nr:hypothetical protein [Candidatus Saganbacteria bacterium]
MKKFGVFLSLFLIVALCAPSFAIQAIPTPTISGLTGLIRVPSADVLPYKNFNIGAEYGADMQNSISTMNYKVNLGTFRGMEMGFNGETDPATKKIREGVFLNMKLSLSTEDEPYPLKLAIGVENLSSYTQTDVFMVATKYLEQGPKLTFGFLADFPGDKFRPLGVAGIEVPLLSNHLSLMVDGLVGESIGQLDVGARIYLTPTICIHLNGVNILENPNNPQGKDPKSIVGGLSWANPF